MDIISNLIVSVIVAFLAAEYRTKEIIKQSEEDRKNHISKARFEAQFLIFQELSKCIFDMHSAIFKLFPAIEYKPQDPDELEKYRDQLYGNAQEAYNLYTETLYKSTPFLSDEKIFNILDEYRKKCQIQLTIFFDLYWGMLKQSGFEPEEYINKYELRRKSLELREEMDSIYKELREFIYSQGLMVN